MHHIAAAIVREGTLVLSDLPFAEGEHVNVIVVRADKQPVKTASIRHVRQLLKGGVEGFQDPFEPCIPVEDWEMLK